LGFELLRLVPVDLLFFEIEPRLMLIIKECGDRLLFSHNQRRQLVTLRQLEHRGVFLCPAARIRVDHADSGAIIAQDLTH